MYQSLTILALSLLIPSGAEAAPGVATALVRPDGQIWPAGGNGNGNGNTGSNNGNGNQSNGHGNFGTGNGHGNGGESAPRI
ncbi:hypothetical protein ACLBXJ_02615 [Methylobacterium mesophilicum]|uniref:hypothetical protein n=1 Tax=Methylobacterium sp. WL7 TaxID=2603900 RepID=UPI0011CAE970|nr:hypothetical protein [Methylobacterium sp. WL7]TXN46546.1 hypothetical protein FV233_07435 [Methylobacterium sp. WL7]